MSAPKVFISYSHDSEDHKSWALKLAGDLRARGIDVTLDRWDLAPGQDVARFMQNGISEADRVIMICSSNYVRKAENGVGGVGYERLIVTAEVVASIDTKKFIPIIRGNDTSNKVPVFLGPRLYIDFEENSAYEEKLTELAREIHGAPAISKPPLGPNPFSGTPVTLAATRPPAPVGGIESESNFLQGDWFGSEFETARKGIAKLDLSGQMELRSGILHPVSKSQIELLNAVKQSEIRTFGWPIGITLENRDEYRPRPYGDGIRAEVSISKESRDRVSYDYWALRSNGDFYLLQSLFEDNRRPNRIFFDTRIVRVTESLMFLQNLYTKLGAPPDAKIGIKVTHRGLENRILSNASSRRHVAEREARETQSSSSIITVLGTMPETRVDDVRKILEPVFMLFDFTQFDVSIYDDLVRSFERGEVR